jgi:hypothetical protein
MLSLQRVDELTAPQVRRRVAARRLAAAEMGRNAELVRWTELESLHVEHYVVHALEMEFEAWQ